jgi:carboxymethylenebutenolidase
MPPTRSERIRGHDGHEFDGYLSLPEGGSGPGLVVIQEIFGVTDYIRGACERLSGLGYVALAPDLYSRIEPGVDLDERIPDSLGKAFGYMQRLDVPAAIDDAVASLEHLRSVPEVSDQRAGIIGFCLGGGIAYFVAVNAEPEVAVCYYGSAIPDGLGQAERVTCPILFHFGDADEYVPAEKREAVRQAFADRPNTEFHIHPGANHAFDNHRAAMFHHPEAAARAWEQTRDFLARQYPA